MSQWQIQFTEQAWAVADAARHDRPRTARQERIVAHLCLLQRQPERGMVGPPLEGHLTRYEILDEATHVIWLVWGTSRVRVLYIGLPIST